MDAMSNDDTRILLESLAAAAHLRTRAAEAQRDALTHDRESATDDDEHDPEGVTLSSEWSRIQGLIEAARVEEALVHDALARWDAGTYGRCLTCGSAIPLARLEIRPFADRCVPCAS